MQTYFEEFSWVLHRRISDHYITWVEPILLSGRRSSPGSPSRIPPILTPLSRILKALQHQHAYWALIEFLPKYCTGGGVDRDTPFQLFQKFPRILMEREYQETFNAISVVFIVVIIFFLSLTIPSLLLRSFLPASLLPANSQVSHQQTSSHCFAATTTCFCFLACQASIWPFWIRLAIRLKIFATWESDKSWLLFSVESTVTLTILFFEKHHNILWSLASPSWWG